MNILEPAPTWFDWNFRLFGVSVRVSGWFWILPGLLGLDLGGRGAARVEGGRVESVGEEAIALLGVGDDGRVLMMSLDPGQATTIAPPPRL